MRQSGLRGIAAPELPSAPTAKVGGEAVAANGPVSVSASAREPAPTTEVPLPPIESLDGLRSDYQAFFQQPVADELRHAALKKLFADPHFNQMDMLDVYVDDYTQFEPLPAALRMRLPSARDFLSDSERAALEAAEAPTGAAGDAPGSSVAEADVQAAQRLKIPALPPMTRALECDFRAARGREHSAGSVSAMIRPDRWTCRHRLPPSRASQLHLTHLLPEPAWPHQATR